MLTGTQVTTDSAKCITQVSQFYYQLEKGELLQSGYVYLPEENETINTVDSTTSATISGPDETGSESDKSTDITDSLCGNQGV